jgi:hypothetical protein
VCVCVCVCVCVDGRNEVNRRLDGVEKQGESAANRPITYHIMGSKKHGPVVEEEHWRRHILFACG